MWCEAGQRECGYLEHISVIEEVGILSRAFTDDSDYVREQTAGYMEEAAKDMRERAATACKDDVCGVLVVSALNTLQTIAALRVTVKEIDKRLGE